MRCSEFLGRVNSSITISRIYMLAVDGRERKSARAL